MMLNLGDGLLLDEAGIAAVWFCSATDYRHRKTPLTGGDEIYIGPGEVVLLLRGVTAPLILEDDHARLLRAYYDDAMEEVLDVG